MYITQFGGYAFPTEQLELTETAGAGRRGATQALGGMGGSWDDIGYGPDPLAEDVISKTLTLEGSGATEALRKTSLRTQFDALLGQLMQSNQDYNQGVRLLLATMPDSTIRGTWAKCVEVRARWEYYNVNYGWLPVSITFRRSWPVWELIYTNSNLAPAQALYLGDHLGTFDFTPPGGSWLLGSNHGAMVYSGAMSGSLSDSFLSSGNARRVNVTIEFDGQITNPRLTNLQNGYWFEYTGTLAAGDRLVVRSPQCTARLNGALVALTIGTADGQILPWAIEPAPPSGGTQDFTLTGSGTISGTLRIYAPVAAY